MAGTTGLEPAASAVTGQRSNQLNYVPAFAVCLWNEIAAGRRREEAQLTSFIQRLKDTNMRFTSRANAIPCDF